MRTSTARSAEGTPAIVATSASRAVSHTIIGAISSMGVPKEASTKEYCHRSLHVVPAKDNELYGPVPRDEGILHYHGQCPNTADDIDEMISKRGYKIKFYVKRSKFSGEDLETRVAETSDGVRTPALLNKS
ncbi:hypothetical protein INT46_006705 [Mucor plumbeus]|uniref:Uncharacterized protein n=1 Tax=Mucor plumbeus TaxID=97098 RepID=A0A8H7R2C7_9FUNG|nr:hypothetical protein INT46_006705 [Mucor plumbeus]